MGLGLINKVRNDLTIDELKIKFPHKKNTITQDLVDLINESQNDPEFNGAELVDTMVTYQNVMQKNSGSVVQYLDAIKFCAYLESEEDNFTEAYKRTFHKRDFVIQRMEAKTDSPEYKELTSAAARFRRTPMVKDILTQSDMPLHLMFGGSRFKAVAVLAHEMENADYAKDRINAADKLLANVKPPENMQIELGIGISAEGQTMKQMLDKQLAELAYNQRQILLNGGELNTVQKLGVNLNESPIDVEVSDG